jgi:hypothetical protein
MSHKMLIFKAGIDFRLGFYLSPPENQFHDGDDFHKESILWNRCLGSLKLQKFRFIWKESKCTFAPLICNGIPVKQKKIVKYWKISSIYSTSIFLNVCNFSDFFYQCGRQSQANLGRFYSCCMRLAATWIQFVCDWPPVACTFCMR